MNNGTSIKDISASLEKGLEKARKKVIEMEKKNNGYIVISDKDGKVKKIPAKDL